MTWPLRLFILATLSFAACASPSRRTSTESNAVYEKGHAHPAAYGLIDGFTFGKPQEVRPANDFQFYFKECDMTDGDPDKAFFSKTAYSCTEGP